MSRYMAVLFMVLAVGVMASATTLTVPSPDYPTITAALEAAEPGNTIEVTSLYTTDEVWTKETFPILVQKDNISIEAVGDVTIQGKDSHAVFVVGAYREYDETTRNYETVRVSGVSIEGFTIAGGDIGILVKHADAVEISNNVIQESNGEDPPDEGIRLLDASGCTIEGNTIVGVPGVGIGIFLEKSGTNADVDGAEKNTLSNNTVKDFGMGLFIFGSEGNKVEFDSYINNDNGGVVLNDSRDNTLTDITVKDNEGWGVRFVFADNNELRESRIEDNTWGGVQLMGAQENLVEGNVVYNNGTPDDGSDDAQIVVTYGDRAIFTSWVIDEYNELSLQLTAFVDLKYEIYALLDGIGPELTDLNNGLQDVRQEALEMPLDGALSILEDLRDVWVSELQGELDDILADIDSLIGYVEDWFTLGLITEQDRDLLLGKLGEARALAVLLDASLDDIDGYLEGLYALISDDQVWGNDHRAQKDLIDAEKAKMKEDIALMRYKLCRVDHELPPFPEVNSDLLGKKEKPFEAITSTEIDEVKDAIVGKLNVDPVADAVFFAATEQTPSWTHDHIDYEQEGLRASSFNTISSNLISSDLKNADNNIGIVIECDHNVIVNNVITNERVEPIDETTEYAQVHRLDVAMILLADECLIAYNTIEWVDQGIIRGGTWLRKDIQVEYTFDKFAEAAYWPGTETRFPLSCDHPETGLPYTYNAEDFDSRPVAWVPVLSVTTEEVVPENSESNGYLGFADSQRVERNRIALNFFERCGTTIDIFDARSNEIDQNLFYRCANGIVFRAPGKHPWWDGANNGAYDLNIGGGAQNIRLEGNDYFGGIAVDNRDGSFMVSADDDYTPPQGETGHATVSDHVNPPAATAPHAYDNFLTPDKFEALQTWVQSRMGFEVDLLRFKWDGLAPNLEYFYEGVVLPNQKPRHPQDVFGKQPEKSSITLEKGYHMISVPAVPPDNSPDNVFKSINAAYTLAEYVNGEYVTPTEIVPERGYWIYLWDEATLEMTGQVTTPAWQVHLANKGFHQVSSAMWAAGLEDVKFVHNGDEESFAGAVDEEWIAPMLFYWDHDANGYVGITVNNTPVLDPWTGYWLRTLEDDITMVLPDEPWPGPADQAQGLGGIPLSSMDIPAEFRPPAPPMLSELTGDLLTAVSYPSPVTGEQATFRVTGLPVDEVRVTVLDLSGRKVWQAESAGNQLSWNLKDSAGRIVANGVYLYQVEAKVGDQWVSAQVDRLLIVR